MFTIFFFFLVISVPGYLQQSAIIVIRLIILHASLAIVLMARTFLMLNVTFSSWHLSFSLLDIFWFLHSSIICSIVSGIWQTGHRSDSHFFMVFSHDLESTCPNLNLDICTSRFRG